MPRDQGYLIDILEQARRTLEFAEGLDQKTFAQDVLHQFAILHCLTIIGEATRRISDEFKEAHPDIAWHGMLGMRNPLVHEYDQVNLTIVWDVLNKHIPALITLIEPLIPPDDEIDVTTEDNE